MRRIRLDNNGDVDFYTRYLGYDEVAMAYGGDLYCIRCGECCKEFPPIVTEKELKMIQIYTGLKDIHTERDVFKKRLEEQRRKRAARLRFSTSSNNPIGVTDKEIKGLYLLKGPPCIFLTYEGEEAVCKIEEVKPKACINYGPPDDSCHTWKLS